jgi:RHS repeat-associated protein
MKYNIRGWLKEINDISYLDKDLFAFQINYNDPDANFEGDALFNGNISQTHWKTATNNQNKSYGYTYDNLNRLLHAKYYAANDPAPTDKYNETLQYDKNGNITFLQRYGSYNTHKQLIDDLAYSYSGNQLMNVNESTYGHGVAGFKDGNVKLNTNLDDYQYDDFGNMIIDRNKGITNINYNHLNLPRYIVFNNNNQTSLSYTYNAAGQKVKKTASLGTTNNVSSTSLTDYLGGYQYNNGTLQFFPHAEGYVKHTVNPTNGASEFDYVYQYKDHLGNIRINYTFDTASSSLKVLEENHYYPFGLKHQENLQVRSIRFSPSTFASNEWIKGVGFFEQPPMAALVPNSGYQYKYNGKEWQDELGLNMYDMDMRQYDPAIARWVVQDPVVHHSMSPYNAFDNNPVFWADPSGADAENCATCDSHGRQTIVNGKYIPVSERTKSSGIEDNGDGKYNHWVVSTFKYNFNPTNEAKNKGEDVISFDEYFHNKNGNFLTILSLVIINEGSITFKSTTVIAKNDKGGFDTIKYNTMNSKLDGFVKIVIAWQKFDDSSPLQYKATQNREWNATEGKKQNEIKNFLKNKISSEASKIPRIGPAIALGIKRINTDVNKPEHADLIVKVKTKLTPIN